MSLDPRINRLDLHRTKEGEQTNSHLVTWEVFHQEKRGKQPVHVGIVHAPTPEMAMIFAKEQYARRGKTTNLWVVKTSDVYTFSCEDEDIFETTPEKTFRDPAFYRVRERIEAYQAKNKDLSPTLSKGEGVK
jgi:ring-1,2-phenylacetyl-CoA epoxidase subunit PaaB